MGIEFTQQESSVLYGLIAESTNDIILKTDRAGFVRHASAAFARLGFRLPDMLFGPHLLDFVEANSAPAIRAAHADAVEGRASGKWTEFDARTAEGGRQRFAMRMSSLIGGDGRSYGALCIMRDIEAVRRLEDRLFAAELTDRLTGLTNRTAFISMLQHLVDIASPGCLALLDIDHFRSVNMRYGQSAGDRVLVAFATFLKNLTRAEDIVSRVGGESFAILLPNAEPHRAEAVCERIVSNLAQLGRPTASNRLALTASAGIARIGETLDATIRGAEIAVFLAKAKGRNCVEVAHTHQS